jgi:predicted nucleic acid-binding protein
MTHSGQQPLRPRHAADYSRLVVKLAEEHDRRISPGGEPAMLLACGAEGAFDLIVSPKLLDRLARALDRPKFRRYATHEDVREYVESLRRQAVHVDDPLAERDQTPDPGDDYLVALARAADVPVLVSGDAHLTDRRPLAQHTGEAHAAERLAGITTTSSTTASRGAWHTLELHAVIGSTSTTEVWLDGIRVDD